MKTGTTCAMNHAGLLIDWQPSSPNTHSNAYTPALSADITLYVETELAQSTAHKWPLAARSYLGVGGTSLDEDEGKGNQEEDKQIQLCMELGMGMDTRKWKSPVNFNCF